MKQVTALLSFLSCFAFWAEGQMMNGTDTLYGNEWIDYSKTYVKISVPRDGIYRVGYADLAATGAFGAGTPAGAELQLYRDGAEVPMFVTSDAALSASDYIEFYGEQNRAGIDYNLYRDSAHLLNPEYSLVTDTSAYFLVWAPGSSGNLRYAGVANNLSGAPAPETYFMRTYWRNFTNAYQKGKEYQGVNSGSELGRFDVGEGYGKVGTLNSSESFALNNVTGIFASGPPAEFTVRVMLNNTYHNLSVSYDGTNYVTNNAFYSDWNVREIEFDVPATSLKANANFVLQDNGGGTFKMCLAYVKFVYPCTYNTGTANTELFSLAGDALNSKYLEFTGTGLATSTETVVLLDRSNGQRLVGSFGSSKMRFHLPASANERELVVSRVTTLGAAALEARQFVDYSAAPGDYLIITHEALRDDGSGNDYVQQYADYRASALGGGFDVEIVDIGQLYDQFAFGLERHPLSIRNFVHYLIFEKGWPIDYIFILGKGRMFFETRSANQLAGAPFYVPTIGTPPSDNLMATSNFSNVPLVPVGRLAARKADDIRLYLEKVQAFEGNQRDMPQTIEGRAWMKQVIHLGGGDPAIQTSIQTRLEAMRDLAIGSKMGADVTSFYKTSTDPVQIFQPQALKDRINAGISMLTFFGHASTFTLDADIGEPSDYDNEGLYPIIYAIGCYAGHIHAGPALSLSEKYVLAEDRGAVGLLSSSSFSSLSILADFGNRFYTNTTETMYGESIGNILKATLAEMESIGTSFSIQRLTETMAFHGDPALRINPQPGVDLIGDPSTSKVLSNVVSVRDESIPLSFEVYNLGLYEADSFNVEIVRALPDGSLSVPSVLRLPVPRYSATTVVDIPNTLENANAAIGENKIFIRLDTDDEIAELPNPAAEANNDMELRFFVVSNDVRPVFPDDYSMVTGDVVLKASTTDAFVPEQAYLFEIDTTQLFNSPAKQSGSVTQLGGIVRWAPGMAFQDGTVYYWRVAVEDALVPGEYNWHRSSFLYTADTYVGWNQSHYYQLVEPENNYATLELAEPNRQFGFELENKELNFYSGAIPYVGFSEVARVYFDGYQLDQFSFCIPARGVIVNVIDPDTYLGWENPPGGLYGSTNCLGNVVLGFTFRTDEAINRQDLMNFLNNVIPDGHYVVISTIQHTNSPANTYQPEEWAMDSVTYGSNLFQILEGQGAQLIRQTESNPRPYVFFYRKNTPSFQTGEALAVDVQTPISGTFFVPVQATEGHLRSMRIGPATAWGSLEWQLSGEDAQDQSYMRVYGLDADANEALIHDWVASDTTLANISAEQYPYLRVEWRTKDPVNKSAAQLDYWRVYYKPVMDVALDPAAKYKLSAATVQQGEPLSVEVAVENVSQASTDSLLIQYRLVDEANNEILLSKRMDSLQAGDTLVASYQFDTRQLSGAYRLIIEANPNQDQREYVTFNNLGLRAFSVEGDGQNPLLDVTFDGRHIMNGDLISAKPIINIALKDENPYLALADSSLLKLKVRFPDESEYREYGVDGNTLVFYPAEAGNLAEDNKAMLEFRPDFDRDGSYELLVEGRDATGNVSGSVAYKVNFEVINATMVSNVLNYPNPFSTATQFVFTLTGDRLPDNMKIQIMTISGQVVREITMAELGPLHIGTNRTEFRWDGTDAYGDRLANGVYLYRVVTHTDGEQYETYDTGTDAFFKHGFGKLMILR